MHPSMLDELIRSNHRDLIEHHQKLMRLRQLEIHDRAWIDTDADRPFVAVPPSAFLRKIAEWFGRMRPAGAS